MCGRGVTMRIRHFIPIVAVIGVGTLFFFPEPESNFIAYLATASAFVAAIICLLVWSRKR